MHVPGNLDSAYTIHKVCPAQSRDKRTGRLFNIALLLMLDTVLLIFRSENGPRYHKFNASRSAQLFHPCDHHHLQLTLNWLLSMFNTRYHCLMLAIDNRPFSISISIYWSDTALCLLKHSYHIQTTFWYLLFYSFYILLSFLLNYFIVILTEYTPGYILHIVLYIYLFIRTH